MESNSIEIQESKNEYKTNSVLKYLEEFAFIADDWFQKNDWLEKRLEFFADFYNVKNIEKYEWEDFQKLKSNLHSFSTMRIAGANALGRPILPVENYRNIFTYLTSEKDPIDITMDNLFKKKGEKEEYHLPYFGESTVTELFQYAFPEKYIVLNGRTVDALNFLGIKFKKKRGESLGQKFKRFNEIITPIENEYVSIVGKRTNTPARFELDQFFSWLSLKEIPLLDESSEYHELVKKFNSDNFNQYISILRNFISDQNLSPDDKRISFNVRLKEVILVFIIGNRYTFSLSKKNNIEQFAFASNEKLSSEAGTFSVPNSDEILYYNYVGEIEGLEIKVSEGLKKELDRNNKSPYRKYNNTEFAEDVFQMEIDESLILEEPETKLKKTVKEATNRIFYGPPGTGKTYFLKDELFDKYTSQETSISKEQYFETVVSGCSWWQVIAIALLDIGKSKVSDIYNHEWIQKKESLSASKSVRPTLWGQLQSHTVAECEHVNVANRMQPLLFNKTEASYWEILKDQVDELAPELYELKNSIDHYNPDPDKTIKHYDFVTFHQSFAYEDFIEGIKPIIPEIEGEETKDLGYIIEDGVFKKICTKAKNDPENRYAIFIDEINRGNVSAIFGELITLIETDKRKGTKNEMSITLPYSKKEFSVPSNLDIYGTMNTADRSVEALDTALRRRFEFKEMMPDYNVISDEYVDGISLSQLLQTINQRIELLIDRDHTIGHSYFYNVNSKQKLASAFNNKIVPLLQEYFYGDYGKIGLVLGNGFVQKIKNDTIEFAPFEYENANDFKTSSFVLTQVTSNTIMEAIDSLLENIETVAN